MNSHHILRFFRFSIDQIVFTTSLHLRRKHPSFLCQMNFSLCGIHKILIKKLYWGKMVLLSCNIRIHNNCCFRVHYVSGVLYILLIVFIKSLWRKNLPVSQMRKFRLRTIDYLSLFTQLGGAELGFKRHASQSIAHIGQQYPYILHSLGKKSLCLWKPLI